ncbi:hypothetical protein GQ457_08G008470 [Hibiscus cannabinus]
MVGWKVGILSLLNLDFLISKQKQKQKETCIMQVLLQGWSALFSAAAYAHAHAHGDGSNPFWESLHPPQISPSSLSNQTFSHFN